MTGTRTAWFILLHVHVCMIILHSQNLQSTWKWYFHNLSYFFNFSLKSLLILSLLFLSLLYSISHVLFVPVYILEETQHNYYFTVALTNIHLYDELASFKWRAVTFLVLPIYEHTVKVKQLASPVEVIDKNISHIHVIQTSLYLPGP